MRWCGVIIDFLWDMNTVVRVDKQRIRDLVELKFWARCSIYCPFCGRETIYWRFQIWGLWASCWASCVSGRCLWWALYWWHTHRIVFVRVWSGTSTWRMVRGGEVFGRCWPIIRRWLVEKWLRSGWGNAGYSIPQLVNARGLWHGCGHYRCRVGESPRSRVGTRILPPIGDYCFGCWATRLFRSNIISTRKVLRGLEWWLWCQFWWLWHRLKGLRQLWHRLWWLCCLSKWVGGFYGTGCYPCNKSSLDDFRGPVGVVGELVLLPI